MHRLHLIIISKTGMPSEKQELPPWDFHTDSETAKFNRPDEEPPDLKKKEEESETDNSFIKKGAARFLRTTPF